MNVKADKETNSKKLRRNILLFRCGQETKMAD